MRGEASTAHRQHLPPRCLLPRNAVRHLAGQQVLREHPARGRRASGAPHHSGSAFGDEHLQPHRSELGARRRSRHCRIPSRRHRPARTGGPRGSRGGGIDTAPPHGSVGGWHLSLGDSHAAAMALPLLARRYGAATRAAICGPNPARARRAQHIAQASTRRQDQRRQAQDRPAHRSRQDDLSRLNTRQIATHVLGATRPGRPTRGHTVAYPASPQRRRRSPA